MLYSHVLDDAGRVYMCCMTYVYSCMWYDVGLIYKCAIT